MLLRPTLLTRSAGAVHKKASGVSLSLPANPLQRSQAPCPGPAPPAAAKGASASALGVTCRRFRGRLDVVLATIERPARDGFAFAREAVMITATLVAAVAQLAGEAYRDYVHFRLRRFVRFAIGTPFLVALLYLLSMTYYYMPEPSGHLDTSCVAGLPLCHTADELVELAFQTRKAYRRALRRSMASRAKDGAGAAASPTTATASAGLTAEERNAAMRGLFVILRSIERVIVGTPEERALIEPSPNLLGPETTIRSSSVGGAAAPSSAVTNTRPASPAEFSLRVVLSIALEQGWFDIAECARGLYDELVKHAPTPTQARVVSAVGDLCSLSYELEHFSSESELTLDQRRRFARAIDTFRPERAVEERSTIASEISVLPLSDGDNSTRCLSMIRHSRGRKPQLVMCFVGSNSARNWVTNFNYLSAPLPPSFGVGGGARVHRGFLKMLDSIHYDEMAADFDEVILVGHSLGGALAQLAGLRLATERPSRRITVITMASPRVLATSRKASTPGAPAPTAASTPVPDHEETVLLPTLAPSVAEEARKRAKSEPLHPAPAHAVHMHSGAAAEGSSSASSLLQLPANYRHFRGYIRADVVPKLPPERFFHYTHVGGRIPLNTGCKTVKSFLGWGFWTTLFHNSDLYSFILKDPPVAQTHFYIPAAGEQQVQEVFSDDSYTLPAFA